MKPNGPRPGCALVLCAHQRRQRTAARCAGAAFADLQAEIEQAAQCWPADGCARLRCQGLALTSDNALALALAMAVGDEP